LTTPSFDEKITSIQSQIGQNGDLTNRMFSTPSGQRGALFFLDGLTDQDKLDRIVLTWLSSTQAKPVTADTIRQSFPIADLRWQGDTDSIGNAVAAGHTLLTLDGMDGVFLLGLQKWAERNPERPDVESTVKGSQSGFVESLKVNISLVRRFIKHSDLRVEQFTVGNISQTRVTLMYLEGVVQTVVLEEARKRLKSLKADMIYSTSQIVQLIDDNVWSVFPLARITERPDLTAMSLAEGRVALLCDQSPFAMVAPCIFFDTLKNIDDYNEKWQIGLLFRIVRLIALMISLLLPGLYIALGHYNPGLIPTELLLSMIASVANVPFLLFVELLIMELVLEILREAGIRLPKPIGQTIGIVGGIVLGQAAVQANLVSPVTLIVVALTAMASFCAPVYSLSLTFRAMRFFLIFAALFLGLYGFVLAFLVMLSHLASLRSFGVPYLQLKIPLRLPKQTDSANEG
jgi:hypothetical protein